MQRWPSGPLSLINYIVLEIDYEELVETRFAVEGDILRPLKLTEQTYQIALNDMRLLSYFDGFCSRISVLEAILVT